MLHMTPGVVLSLTGAVLSCGVFALACVMLLALSQEWLVERYAQRVTVPAGRALDVQQTVRAARERLERWG